MMKLIAMLLASTPLFVGCDGGTNDSGTNPDSDSGIVESFSATIRAVLPQSITTPVDFIFDGNTVCESATECELEVDEAGSYTLEFNYPDATRLFIPQEIQVSSTDNGNTVEADLENDCTWDENTPKPESFDGSGRFQVLNGWARVVWGLAPNGTYVAPDGSSDDDFETNMDHNGIQIHGFIIPEWVCGNEFYGEEDNENNGVHLEHSGSVSDDLCWIYHTRDSSATGIVTKNFRRSDCPES